MKILVTGGAGYIGSHTCLELLREGHTVYVIDSLYNGSKDALNRVELLANRKLAFHQCDVRDANAVNKIFDQFKPNIVVHFAGLKDISESLIKPELYQEVNVKGISILLEAMKRSSCKRIVFSSSASVYGKPQYLPCDENHPTNPNNPYGLTKLSGENLLRDWSSAEPGRQVVALRYFNPVGAHPSGLIGENPNENPSNIMPSIAQVACGHRDYLQIFGDDYNTIDGTAVRDYIHVMDLAEAHVLAIEKINQLEAFEVINIGTGAGQSVLQIVKEFERQSGRDVAFYSIARRRGDVPAIWANSTKAFNKLGFSANRRLAEMCQDTWRWQSAKSTDCSVD